VIILLSVCLEELLVDVLVTREHIERERALIRSPRKYENLESEVCYCYCYCSALVPPFMPTAIVHHATFLPFTPCPAVATSIHIPPVPCWGTLRYCCYYLYRETIT
jgi:hypothetical protein